MSKLISVADDVYKELKKRKKKRSFSELLRNLLKNRDNGQDIMKFAGEDLIDEKLVKEAKEMINKWDKSV